MLATLSIGADGKDTVESIHWYRRAAELGNMAAAYTIAGKYERGDGVPADAKEAIRWYRRAAELGHYNGTKAADAIEFRNGLVKPLPRYCLALVLICLAPGFAGWIIRKRSFERT